MRCLFAGLFALGLSVCSAFAAESCEDGRRIKTPFGKMMVSECVDQSGHTIKKYISLDQSKILEDKYLSADLAADKSRVHWVFSGPALASTGCAQKLYLVDLSVSPAKVFSFGIKNACNEFSWASWGDQRSVIGLKKDVRFVYENGQLIPPKAGEQLWNSVEPPHAGPGLKIEDAIPFVELVPPPASP